MFLLFLAFVLQGLLSLLVVIESLMFHNVADLLLTDVCVRILFRENFMLQMSFITLTSYPELEYNYLITKCCRASQQHSSCTATILLKSCVIME